MNWIIMSEFSCQLFSAWYKLHHFNIFVFRRAVSIMFLVKEMSLFSVSLKFQVHTVRKVKIF